MARETWAVYSVRDHLNPYAFVSDVLLYDRLLLPTPSPDDLDRWIRNGWDPDRQEKLRAALGDRCQAVDWDAERQERWQSAYAEARHTAGETGVDAFKLTRRQLIEELPRRVTGVDTVAAYSGFDSLRDDVTLETLDRPDVDPGLVSAAFAFEFAVPAEMRTPPRGFSQEVDVLTAAIELSSTKAYQRNRRSYWRMVKEFSSGVVTSEDAMIDAVEEMRDLVEEQNELARKGRTDTAVRVGFLASSVTLGMISGMELPVVAAASAVLAVGEFTWSELRARRTQPTGDESRVVALFSEVDRGVRDKYFRRNR